MNVEPLKVENLISSFSSFPRDPPSSPGPGTPFPRFGQYTPQIPYSFIHPIQQKEPPQIFRPIERQVPHPIQNTYHSYSNNCNGYLRNSQPLNAPSSTWNTVNVHKGLRYLIIKNILYTF